jgi:hypothetical protein
MCAQFNIAVPLLALSTLRQQHMEVQSAIYNHTRALQWIHEKVGYEHSDIEPAILDLEDTNIQGNLRNLYLV